MAKPQHLSVSDDWYTPLSIVDPAKQLLGKIDFDPASCEEANKRIKATLFLDKEHDALSYGCWSEVLLTLPATVFLNPPSVGKAPGNKSWAGLYWQKLMQFRDSGMLDDAIYVCFSLNQLQVLQNYHKLSPLNFPMVVPESRIPFDTPGDCPKKKSPTHPSAIVYVPGWRDQTHRFIELFGHLGACKGY